MNAHIARWHLWRYPPFQRRKEPNHGSTVTWSPTLTPFPFRNCLILEIQAEFAEDLPSVPTAAGAPLADEMEIGEWDGSQVASNASGGIPKCALVPASQHPDLPPTDFQAVVADTREEVHTKQTARLNACENTPLA